MSAPFSRAAVVGWRDLDANRHMKNTAYMEHAVDTRFAYFSSVGIDSAAFERLQIGPVVLRDEISYARELHVGDSFIVQMLCGGMNAKGSRAIIVNRLVLPDGFMAYEIRSIIVWLDLRKRKVCIPPPELLGAIETLVKTDDHKAL